MSALGPKARALHGLEFSLAAFVAEHELKSKKDFDAEHDVDRRCRQLFEERLAKAEIFIPSLRVVPRFHWVRRMGRMVCTALAQCCGWPCLACLAHPEVLVEPARRSSRPTCETTSKGPG